ncbi:hypothetical protein Tco_0053422 [Tanacetum coccineum]
MQHVNTKILKENQNLRNELKELTSITEAWLNSSNKVNQCISEKIPTQKKKILGINQLTKDTSSSRPKDPMFIKSSADNSEMSITGSNKPMLSGAKDFTLSNHDTGKHPLPPLEKLTGAEPISGLKTIKSILKSKSTLKDKTFKRERRWMVVKSLLVKEYRKGWIGFIREDGIQITMRLSGLGKEKLFKLRMLSLSKQCSDPKLILSKWKVLQHMMQIQLSSEREESSIVFIRTSKTHTARRESWWLSEEVQSRVAAKQARFRAPFVLGDKAYEDLYKKLDSKEGANDIFRIAKARERRRRDLGDISYVNDEGGRSITNEEEIKKIWGEYFSSLFNATGSEDRDEVVNPTLAFCRNSIATTRGSAIRKLLHEDTSKRMKTYEVNQKNNDVKEKSMLLMALPNEHLLTFNPYKDAKTLFAAIQKRFGSNEATKRTRKTLLKQMYENFSAPSTESLDSIFNRLQKIVSQLAILGENISQEDLNLKFLRSLPSKWNTHVMVWRNKPDLDTMSFDDLYNNFKIVEHEVKGTASSSSSSQNLAFMSSTSSTNEVNTAYGIITANTQDLEQIHEDDLKEMDLKWQLALLSIRIRKFFQKTGRKITINGSDTVGYDKSRNQDNSRRTINVEEISSKAMLAIDGAGFDWNFMADEEVPTNMALMAFLDSEFNKSEFNLATYKRGLASVEEQLVFYKKNEVLFCEQLARRFQEKSSPFLISTSGLTILASTHLRNLHLFKWISSQCRYQVYTL